MRIRQYAVAPIALSLALTGVLSGCGEDEKSPRGAATKSTPAAPSTSASEAASASAEPEDRETADPAAGKQFEGQGFSFNAPKGWTDATAKAKELNSLVELAAAAAPDDTGFATNVNVVVADAGVEQPNEQQMQQISDAIEKRLTSLVPKLKVNGTTKVADQPALDHEGAATKSGVNYYIHQFVAFREGKAYTITFSFSRQHKPAQRQQVIDAVLASWSWS